MPDPTPGTTGKTGTGRRSGAERDAAEAGAADPAAVTSAENHIGLAPAADNRPPRQRRDWRRLGIILASILGGLLLLGLLIPVFARDFSGSSPAAPVTVKVIQNQKVIVNSGNQPAGVAPTDSATATPSPSPSNTPSPTPSESYSGAAGPMESATTHWISDWNFNTACHQQFGNDTSAVYNPSVYNALPASYGWQCWDVALYSSHPWYSATGSVPLGSIVSTVIDLNQYCSTTYGPNWHSEVGSNDHLRYASPDEHPELKWMCTDKVA